MVHYTATQLWISFAINLIIAGLTAYYAQKRGRNANGWFALGLLFSFFAPIALFLLPALGQQTEQSKTELLTPKAPGPEDKAWYYLDEHHQSRGPVSLVALQEEWNRGRLKLESYVWCDGMDKWQKVEETPDLHKALARKPGSL